jgi:tripartite-type tricarboxylate transporter receptor subunit TctC
MPDMPTVAEAGGLKGYDISTWWGLFAPAGTSSEIVHRLSANMAKIVTLPDIRDRFAALGIEPAANTPEQFALLVKAEVEKFARLAKAAGIKPE